MTETTMADKAKHAIILKARRDGNDIIYQDENFVAEVEEHNDHIDVFVHRWFVVDDVDNIDEIENQLRNREARRFHEKGMLKTIMALEERKYKSSDNLRPIPCIDFVVYEEGHKLALLVRHVNFQFEKEVECD